MLHDQETPCPAATHIAAAGADAIPASDTLCASAPLRENDFLPRRPEYAASGAEAMAASDPPPRLRAFA